MTLRSGLLRIYIYGFVTINSSANPFACLSATELKCRYRTLSFIGTNNFIIFTSVREQMPKGTTHVPPHAHITLRNNGSLLDSIGGRQVFLLMCDVWTIKGWIYAET
jgi:hypothetical protein